MVQLLVPGYPAAGIGEATRWTNTGIRIVLAIIAMASVADIIKELRSILRRNKSRSLNGAAQFG